MEFDETPTMDISSADLERIRSSCDPLREAAEVVLSETQNTPGLLNGGCFEGGAPDEDAVKWSLDSQSATSEGWEIEISALFDESVPSSCKDMPYRKPRRMQMTASISAESGEVTITHETESLEDFDQY